MSLARSSHSLSGEYFSRCLEILIRTTDPRERLISSKIYSQSVEATKLSPAKLGAQPDLASKEQPVPSIEDFLRRPDEASLRIGELHRVHFPCI
jgi:hypothetical protein